MSRRATVLQASGLGKSFGGVRALDGVGLSLETGQSLGVIGPNGSGKTTLLNTVSGFVRPDQGKVSLEGTDISGLAPHSVAARGLTRTFQTPRPMAGLTPLENLVVAVKGARKKRKEAALTHGRLKARAAQVLEKVDLGGYAGKSGVLAGELTLYELRRLELARCLALNPAVILFDEIFSGLSHDEADHLALLVSAVKMGGVAMILVEHRLSHLFRLVKKVMVLDFGRCIFEGGPDQAMTSRRVGDAYFGLKTGGDHAPG